MTIYFISLFIYNAYFVLQSCEIWDYVRELHIVDHDNSFCQNTSKLEESITRFDHYHAGQIYDFHYQYNLISLFFFVAVQEEIFSLRVLSILNKSLHHFGCFSSKNIKKVKVKLISSIVPFNYALSVFMIIISVRKKRFFCHERSERKQYSAKEHIKI